MYLSYLPNFLCLLIVVTGTHRSDIEEKEEIRKTLRFANPSAAKQVEVDNLNGSIQVVGYGGQEVQLVAYKTLRGRSPEKIQEARQKVQLEISEEENTITLYVDAPCRSRDGRMDYKGDRYYGYQVNFDFELKVPYQTDLYLKTINDGEIKIENISGDYDIDNINGGIEMRGIAGSGRAYALNGEVNVFFNKNPVDDSYFGSLNGDIEITFQPNLSANFQLKTFNGEVFTDFPVTYLANSTPIQERHKGKYVYKYDRAFGVRVGDGGAKIELDAFNGDIRIIKSEK